MKRIYFLFFYWKEGGFQGVSRSKTLVMPPIDRAMNYFRDAALGMTQLPLKGNPSILGMPGGQAPYW